MQLHLTASTSKGLKVREAIVFTSLYDIRLKYFKEISDCLHYNQYVSCSDLPDNKCDTMSDQVYDVADPKNEEYCNIINYFIKEDEKMEQ